MIAATATLNQLTTALEANGLKMPAAALRWTELRAELDQLAQHRDPDFQEVVDTLDPATLSEAVDLLTRQAVETETRIQVRSNLTQATAGRAVNEIRSRADDLTAQARKSFDSAARAIVKHADAYDPDDASEQVLTRGAEAAEGWRTIGQASADLDAHLSLWSLLYSAPIDLAAAVETYDGDHWRRIDGEQLFTQPNRWHALVRAGYRLRLNTLKETAAMLANTPEKQLRTGVVKREGFTVFEQARG